MEQFDAQLEREEELEETQKQRLEIKKLVIAQWLITVNKPLNIEDMIRMIVNLILNEVEGMR